MAWLGSFLAGVVTRILSAVSFFAAGASWLAGRMRKTQVAVKDQQLEDAANRPRDRRDLADRVRRGGL